MTLAKNNIAFIDTEVDIKSQKLLDIGGTTMDGSHMHSSSIEELRQFIKKRDYLCGHNIFKHDLPIVERALNQSLSNTRTIDTLFLSPLLFPTKPYHALLKDDKLQTEELNNPLNDAMKARDLFNDEVAAFQTINDDLKQVYYALLGDQKEFSSFSHYLGYQSQYNDLSSLIKSISNTDPKKRELYVAMTRAKQNLTIHKG